MKESVCSSCSSLYWGLFENGFRRAEKGAECEVVRALNLNAAQALGAQTILFRDERVRGALHRLTLTLLAEDGEDMQLDVTAFAPDASYEGVPELPSILGLHGCLESVRFAFDPVTDTFYFGPTSPTV
jgi:hypothetical protein